MTGSAPSDHRRDRVLGFAGAIALLADAGVLAWFGVNDLFGNTDYGVRVRAGGMAIVAILVAVGAVVLLVHLLARNGRGGRAAGAVVLASALTTAALGLLLGIYQLTAGDVTPWLGVWAAMLASGTVLAVFLVNRGARLPYPRQFAFAATITTLITIGNFTYGSVYQPSSEPVQFDVQATIGKPSFPADHRSASLPITLSFRNTGRVGLVVVMTTYSLVGRRATFLAVDKSREQVNLDADRGRAGGRRTDVQGYDVLQSDRFIFAGTTFQAGDAAEANRTVAIAVPTGYDAFALNAWVVVLRADDVHIRTDISLTADRSWDPATGRHVKDAPDWAAVTGVDWALHRIPIEETSYLRAQTRRPWTGYVWIVASDPAVGRPPGSYLSYHFTPSGTAESDKPTADEENGIAIDRYGLTRSATGLLEKSVHELGLT